MTPRLREGDPAAFWARVKRGTKRECWPWQRYIGHAGYGTVKWRGRMMRAHRLAYELAVGPVPDELFVLHSCDNPPCCNPAHLRPGTQLDNMTDRSVRGRAPGNSVSVGERHVRHKLTVQEVLTIRAEYAARRSHSVQLGRRFGVHPSTISQIVNRETWKHVPPDQQPAQSPEWAAAEPSSQGPQGANRTAA